MTEKEKREAYIRASDKRVSHWSESKREAFYKAVRRLEEPTKPPKKEGDE